MDGFCEGLLSRLGAPEAILARVASITDFFVEVRNSENDTYFSRFLYEVLKFPDFLRILQFFDFFQHFYHNWESLHASTMEFMDC